MLISVQRLRREMDVWWKLDHPNVVPLWGYTDDMGPLPSMISPVGRHLPKDSQCSASLVVREWKCIKLCPEGGARLRVQTPAGAFSTGQKTHRTQYHCVASRSLHWTTISSSFLTSCRSWRLETREYPSAECEAPLSAYVFRATF
jgi:hypothetical protein